VKKIALADLGEFVYRDYKEPFEQLEGGYPGHPKGALLADENTGKLLCAYCGKTYDQLGSHAHHAHGLTADNYRQEVGLATYTALVSDRVRARHLIRAIRDADKWEVTRLRGRKAAAFRQDATTGIGQWRPEVLNKQGRCHAQALSVARQLALRGRLTSKELQRRGIGPKTVRVYWPGGLDELRMLVGAVTPKTVTSRRLTDEQAIQALRNLALAIGRTPRQSDLNRHGLMTAKSYHNRFGSYTEVCRRAGLVPNKFRSFGFTDEVDILVAYANDGNARRVGGSTGHGEARVLSTLHRYGYPFAPRDSSPRRMEWAADMARRLAGMPDEVAA
jgi:hypothetical protein